MTLGDITFTRDDAVAEITLVRPEKLNALSEAMLDRLDAIAREIDADTDIRAVVLSAAGDRAFCVGADINAWAAYDALDMWRRWIKRGHEVFDRLAGLRQPLIAAIQGPALGGGLELAATADLRIADPAARFGLPETGIATCPGWSGSQRLARLLNPSILKEMMFTGAPLDAARAHGLGLVNTVCPAGAARRSALAAAAAIAARAPVAVQLAKQIVDAGHGDRLAVTLEALAGGLAATTADAAEGIAAFRAKRPPRFEGR